jgi:hypothetical protein
VHLSLQYMWKTMKAGDIHRLVLDWAWGPRKPTTSICQTRPSCGAVQILQSKSMDGDPVNCNVRHWNDGHLLLIMTLQPISWPNTRIYIYTLHSNGSRVHSLTFLKSLFHLLLSWTSEHLQVQTLFPFIIMDRSITTYHRQAKVDFE